MENKCCNSAGNDATMKSTKSPINTIIAALKTQSLTIEDYTNGRKMLLAVLTISHSPITAKKGIGIPHLNNYHPGLLGGRFLGTKTPFFSNSSRSFSLVVSFTIFSVGAGARTKKEILVTQRTRLFSILFLPSFGLKNGGSTKSTR